MGSRAIFYDACLYPCLKQFSCLCCSRCSCKIVWWRTFFGFYFMTKNTIIRHIKPIHMHPCFIRINTIVITNTLIITLNVSIFDLAKTNFMWQRKSQVMHYQSYMKMHMKSINSAYKQVWMCYKNLRKTKSQHE